MKRRKSVIKKYKFSLVFQVAIFFVVGVVLTGILAYGILQRVYEGTVSQQKETLASQISDETASIIKEYPAWEWLLKYWNDNAGKLDVEYDKEEKTLIKARDFVKRNPGFILSNATEKEVRALPEKDQKLYAEIVYNWMLESVNSITKAYKVSFLYCAALSDDYKNATFLLNGSAGNRERGSEYGKAYILGVNVKTTPQQERSISKAVIKNDFLVASGDFIDKYEYLNSIGKRHYIVGVTFDLKSFNEEVVSQTVTGVGFFILLQIILSIVCIFLIYIYNLRPLKSVQKSVQKYGYYKNVEDAVSHLKRINTKNEIEALSKDLIDMVNSIDAYMDEIAHINAEKERIETELNIATRIQSEMLPSVFPPFPKRNELDIFASMHPAKEVGGDFYDFFFVDEKHIVLVMADVSGKGVPAALFMVIAKVLIKNRMLMGDTPGQALHNVNKQLCESNESGMFVTVWLALIDIETGEGLAANAGHEHPVLKRKGGNFEIIRYKHSPAVSLMDEMTFKEHSFVIKPGDCIFVYTDGVTEAQNADGELFGEDRMEEALNKYKDCGIREVVTGMKESIDEYVNGATQFDDITMLAFLFSEYYQKNEEEDE